LYVRSLIFFVLWPVEHLAWKMVVYQGKAGFKVTSQ